MKANDRARYFARMNHSLPDKVKRIAEHIEGPMVLDVGAGDGGLLRHFKGIRGLDSLLSCDVKPARPSVLKCDIFQLPMRFDPGTFDTVILCSVLHEVYSTAGKYGNEEGIMAWKAAVSIAHNMVKPGGRLIIRDGVAPDKSTHMGRAFIQDRNAERWVKKFKEDHPFVYGRRLEAVKNKMDFGGWEKYDWIVEGQKGLLTEFLFTMNWGPASWTREVRERYCVRTLTEYQALLRGLDMKILSAYHYAQPGYREHMSKWCYIEEFTPPTNCMIVIEKEE